MNSSPRRTRVRPPGSLEDPVLYERSDIFVRPCAIYMYIKSASRISDQNILCSEQIQLQVPTASHSSYTRLISSIRALHRGSPLRTCQTTSTPSTQWTAKHCLQLDSTVDGMMPGATCGRPLSQKWSFASEPRAYHTCALPALPNRPREAKSLTWISWSRAALHSLYPILHLFSRI